MASTLETTPGFVPFTTVAFRGVSVQNGKVVNRSNAGYKTVGGYIDSSDSNNTGLTATFGVVVSSSPSGTAGALAIGKPAGYVARGLIMFDASQAQNDPAKSDYFLQNIPLTVVYEGTVRMETWGKTQAGAIDPVLGCFPIYKAITGGVGAAAIGTIEFLPAGTTVPASWAALPGYVVEVTPENGVELEISFDSSAQAEAADLLPFGTPFVATATLTSAAAAVAITLIPDSAVGVGKKVYITNAFAKVNGATNWATTATVAIQDSAAVAGVTYAVAALTGNAFVGLNTANVTVAAPVSTGVGFTAVRGLQIAGNANGTGSDLIVTVTGFIK